MVTAKFLKKQGLYAGFIISGHAGSAEYGQDIVCAGVSSAVMLAVNTITEFFCSDAKVRNEENKIGLLLINPEDDVNARTVLYSLKTHLELLAEEYGCINVKVLQR